MKIIGSKNGKFKEQNERKNRDNMFVLERIHKQTQTLAAGENKNKIENEKLEHRDKCNSLNVPSHGISFHEKNLAL